MTPAFGLDLERHRAQPVALASGPARLRRAVLVLRPVDAPGPAERDNLRWPQDLGPAVEQVVLSPYPLELCGTSRWICSDPPGLDRKRGHLVYALAVLSTEGRTVLSVDAQVRLTRPLVVALAQAVEEGADLAYFAGEGGQFGHALALGPRALEQVGALHFLPVDSRARCRRPAPVLPGSAP